MHQIFIVRRRPFLSAFLFRVFRVSARFLDEIQPEISFPPIGTPNGDASFVSMSYDGRFVAFVSAAANLVLSDPNIFPDVFIWDRMASNQTDSVSLLTQGLGGSSARGGSRSAIITDDASTVFVASSANNLTPAFPRDPRPRFSIFKYSIQEGIGATSPDAVALLPNGSLPYMDTFLCSTSWDGRYFVFQTEDVGFVPPSAVRRSRVPRQIYRKDTHTGEILLVTARTGSNDTIESPSDCTATGAFTATQRRAISADGRFIAFDSSSVHLDPFSFSNPNPGNVFVRDMDNGISFLVSGDRMIINNGKYNRSLFTTCDRPSLASNSSYVAFFCSREPNSCVDTILCDISSLLDGSSPINCTVLSLNASFDLSQTNYRRDSSDGIAVSADGKLVAWSGFPADIVIDPLLSLHGPAIGFLYNASEGQVSWVTRPLVGSYANSPQTLASADGVLLSGNGESLVFISGANMVPGATLTTYRQVYVRNLESLEISRPTRALCPYPTASECAKVLAQMFGYLSGISMSSDASAVAFTVRGAVLNVTANRGVVDALSTDTFTLQHRSLMYINSLPDAQVSLIEQDVRFPIDTSLPVLYGDVRAMSDDSRYIYYVALSPPGSPWDDIGNVTYFNSLFVYDSFKRTHAFVTFGVYLVDHAVISVSADGRWAAFDANFAKKSRPVAGVAFAALFDRLSGNTTYHALTMNVSEFSVPQPAAGATLSGDGRFLFFTSKSFNSSLAGIVKKDLTRAATDPSYQGELISFSASGVPWRVPCYVEQSSFDGSVLLIQCTNFAKQANTVVNQPVDPLYETVGILYDSNRSSYTEKVRLIPLPRPAFLETFVYNLRMPVSLSPSDPEFFVSYSTFSSAQFESIQFAARWFPASGQFAFPEEDFHGYGGISDVAADASSYLLVSSSTEMAPYDVNGYPDAAVIHGRNGTLVNAGNPYCT